MAELIFDDRNICISNSVVYKRWTRNFPIVDWYNLYKDYQKFESRAVKVLEINSKKKYFVMEKIQGYNLESWNYEINNFPLQTLTFDEKKQILSEITEIFSGFFKFSSNYLQNTEIFFNVDFRLANFYYTPNKELKMIDPDSFEIINLCKTNNFLHFGRYIDSLNSLRENMLRYTL